MALTDCMDFRCAIILSCCVLALTSGTDVELRLPDVNPRIYSLHVTSDVTYRFSTTKVTSKLANAADEDKEVTFKVNIPKTAFIMNFTMTIDGETIVGDVKEKKAAKKQYQEAKKKGQSAGHVAAKSRDSSVFKVSINVEARSKVEFNLTYQELLQRRLGLYQNVINISPGQVVRDMRVQVNIRESRAITVLHVPPIREDVTQIIDPDVMNPHAVVRRVSASEAEILYRPTLEEQMAMSPKGILGQFIVRYDVKRDLDAGDLQVIDGYFVHYLAPSGLRPVDKNVLFIIDTSGSMSGLKLQQTKDAMQTVLNDLRASDTFNIVQFSNGPTFWKKDPVRASIDNIRKAKRFVEMLQARGGKRVILTV